MEEKYLKANHMTFSNIVEPVFLTDLNCHKQLHKLYDHCMPECFKDIPWCQKLYQGMDESRARNE